MKNQQESQALGSITLEQIEQLKDIASRYGGWSGLMKEIQEFKDKYVSAYLLALAHDISFAETGIKPEYVHSDIQFLDSLIATA